MRLNLLSGATLVVLGFVGSANAALTVDLRLANGGGKSATVVSGGTVTVNVYALIPDGNGNTADDQLSSINASFLTTGALKADITSAVAVNPWNVSGTHQDTDNPPGSFKINPVDLDSDGDLDIGSNNNGSAPGFFIASAGQFTVGNEFLLGTLSLTITGTSGSTSLNFRPRANAAGVLYRQDNFLFNGTSGAPVAGAPVVLTVGSTPSNFVSLTGTGAGADLGDLVITGSAGTGFNIATLDIVPDASAGFIDLYQNSTATPFVQANTIVLFDLASGTELPAGANVNGATLLDAATFAQLNNAAGGGFDFGLVYATGGSKLSFDFGSTQVGRIAVVPEPASATLALVAGAGLLRRRVRRA